MVGPQGPQGQTGPEGPQGLPGIDSVDPTEAPTPPTVGYLRVQSPLGSLDATFEMVAFELGVSNEQVFSGAGGGGAGKASFAPLEVVLLANQAEFADVYVALAKGAEFSLTLSIVDPSGGAIPLTLATSSLARASSFRPENARNASQSSTVELSFGLADLSLSYGGHSAGYNEVSSQPSCLSTPCGCGPLTPIHYVDTHGASVQLPAAHYEASYFDSLLEMPVNIGSSAGGGSTGVVRDRGVSLEAPLGDDALCLFRSVTIGGHLGTPMRLEDSSPLSGQFGPLYQHTHTLECVTAVTRFTLASDQNGDIVTSALLKRGAFTHTFRTFDPVTGQETSSRSKSWSIIRNNESPACQ